MPSRQLNLFNSIKSISKVNNFPSPELASIGSRLQGVSHKMLSYFSAPRRNYSHVFNFLGPFPWRHLWYDLGSFYSGTFHPVLLFKWVKSISNITGSCSAPLSKETICLSRFNKNNFLILFLSLWQWVSLKFYINPISLLIQYFINTFLCISINNWKQYNIKIHTKNTVLILI